MGVNEEVTNERIGINLGDIIAESGRIRNSQ
jgi:hypothetical protein